MKVKITRYHLAPVKMAINKKTKDREVLKRCEKIKGTQSCRNVN
jgi:hypothetical protein